MADSIKKIVEVEVDVKSGDVKILDRDLNKVLKSTKKLNDQSKAQQEFQSKGARLIDKYTGGLLTQAQTWFKMGKTAVTALTGIKSGLVSTGIGALVVSLGLVVAYWDDIVAFIGDGEDEMQNLIDAQDEYNESIEESERKNKKLYRELKRLGFSELDIKKREIKDAKEKNKLAEEAAKQAFNTVERLKKEKAKGLTSVSEFFFGTDDEDIEKAQKIFKDLERQQEDFQQQLEDRIDEKKQLELDAEDDVTDHIDKSHDKRLQIRQKYLDLKSRLDQAHELELIKDDKERQLKALEFAKENDIKSINQSEFTEQQKADLKEKYERQWLDKKTALEEQWQKENLERLKGYQDEADANREKNQDEFFSDLEKLREEMRLSDLTDQQFEEDAVSAKYFRLIELAKEYGEDVTDLKRSQALEMAEIEQYYSDQSKANLLAEVEAKAIIQLQYLDTVGSLVDVVEMFAGENKKVQKAAILADSAVGIAQTIIAVKAASAAALATPQAIASSGVSAIPVIAATVAAGAASVSGIIKATDTAMKALGGGGSGGGASSSLSGGTSGGGGGSPQFNTVGTSGFNQVAGSIADQNQAPIQAYVVSTDITSQQSLDRNRRNKSAF